MYQFDIQNARTLKQVDDPELGRLYRGKVRDNYFKDGKIIMIATDRISCFDHVLSRQIPFKGQILTHIMKYFVEGVSDIIPHHIIAMPDPQVLIVRDTTPYDVEMVVRGFITGSLWRDYNKCGSRQAGAQYGVALPEGLKQDQEFDEPIVTPTTKAKPKIGSNKSHHDEPVSREEIISPILIRNIDGVGNKGEPNLFYVEQSKYDDMAARAIQVFKRGQNLALNSGLILVDTKYEFGELDNQLYLIDEVHTPDSSRYWYASSYNALFSEGKEQKAMSKEFVREWLIAQGYDKAVGESSLATLNDEIVLETARRYIKLDETLTRQKFVLGDMSRPLEQRIKENLKKCRWC